MHGWGYVCLGKQLRGVYRCKPFWGDALYACHTDMLEAVPHVFVFGLNVGSPVWL
jgi:hypothetical protein